ILRHAIAPLFGIKLRAQLGGAHQVAEQDRELAAFANRQRGFKFGSRRCRARRRRYGPEPLTAGTAELLARLAPGTARATSHGERRAAFRAEAAVGAVVVVAGRAAHRGVSRGDYHAGRKPRNSAPGELSVVRNQGFGASARLRDPAMARYVRSRSRSSPRTGTGIRSTTIANTSRANVLSKRAGVDRAGHPDDRACPPDR